jgi:hypothetical protein
LVFHSFTLGHATRYNSSSETHRERKKRTAGQKDKKEKERKKREDAEDDEERKARKRTERSTPSPTQSFNWEKYKKYDFVTLWGEEFNRVSLCVKTDFSFLFFLRALTFWGWCPWWHSNEW